MPEEVISTVHDLEATCKKYRDNLTTDKDGKIIDDNNNPKHNIEADENIEMTGVGQEYND